VADKDEITPAEILGGKGHKKKGKKGKHPFHRTVIDHHPDGSHTIKHERRDGGEPVDYARPDLDGVHDGLEEHLGEENEAEEIPAAPAPMASPTPAQPA
jgi:hypothetical protein